MNVNDELVGYFHKHLVPMFFFFQKEEDIQRFVVTAFVLSVDTQWFLITAGHCLKAIDNIMVEEGYELIHCSLIDALVVCPS